MKKFFSLITLMLCMVFGSVAFVACGSDDDDTGGGGDPTVTESQILGMWYGVTESNHDLEVFIFNIQANGNGRYLENDANAAAWAEYKIGSSRGTSVSVMLTLGTGVGGGIIINDKLRRQFSRYRIIDNMRQNRIRRQLM